MRKIVCTVKDMHDTGVIHCSIRPENILCHTKFSGKNNANKEIVYKLIGFGNSVKINEPTQQFGSEYSAKMNDFYVPPELRVSTTGPPPTHTEAQLVCFPWDSARDIWCLGCILYSLLTGSEASRTEDPSEIDFHGVEWAGISSEARDLVHKCLNVSPESRYSAADILSHPWIQRSDLVSEEAFSEEYKTSLKMLTLVRKIRKILKNIDLDPYTAEVKASLQAVAVHVAGNAKTTDGGGGSGGGSGGEGSESAAAAPVPAPAPVPVPTTTAATGDATCASFAAFAAVLAACGLPALAARNVFNALDMDRTGTRM
jgi:serine/threonine protein kinase